MPEIYFIDVTNRDGVQTARLGLSKLEKTMLNRYLNAMGIFQSEFGFPTTKHESLYLQANLDLQELGKMRPIRLAGWVRATAEDVHTAFELVPKLKHLNLSISTSEQMIHGKWAGRLTEDDVIASMTRALDAAKEHGAESVGINAEDASRTKLDFLIRFSRAAKEHGADRVRYCDTLGYDNPFTIYDAMKTLAETVELPLEVHCHGDLGMAVGNSLAGAKGALDGGQDIYINTTVNGIGERAGNADSCGDQVQGLWGKVRARQTHHFDKSMEDSAVRQLRIWRPYPRQSAGGRRKCFCACIGHPRGRRSQGPAELRTLQLLRVGARRAGARGDREGDLLRRIRWCFWIPAPDGPNSRDLRRRGGRTQEVGAGALRQRTGAEATHHGRTRVHLQVPGHIAQVADARARIANCDLDTYRGAADNWKSRAGVTQW
jgi:hypothetical protein